MLSLTSVSILVSALYRSAASIAVGDRDDCSVFGDDVAAASDVLNESSFVDHHRN